MNKEFVSYEISKKLKELGFNESCLAHYSNRTREKIPTLIGCGALLFDVDGLLNNTDYEDILCVAPLHQQVFRWIREKYKILATIETLKVSTSGKEGYRFTWFFYNFDNFKTVVEDKSLLGFYSYEEAEEDCLLKLIELIKNE